jgi:hypothetical protein
VSRTASNVVIVVGTLLAHGLLLVNDGTYWDDWLITGSLGPRRLGVSVYRN